MHDYQDNLTCMAGQAAEIAAVLKMLSHPNRLMIACRLMGGESPVGKLEQELSIRQPILSRELAKMRDSGLLKTRRESRTIYYRLSDERLARTIGALYAAFGENPASPKTTTDKQEDKS